jgi:OmpA-OmpF porin, OOP family
MPNADPKPSGTASWLWPLIGAVVVIALGLYYWNRERATMAPPIAQTPAAPPAPAPVASAAPAPAAPPTPAPAASATPAPVASAAPAPAASATPAPAAQTPATEPPRLELSNENGVVHVSGSVHDDGAKVSILDALKSVFGADKVQAEIGVDANRGPAPWLAKLGDALASLKMSGVQADFDGGSVDVGGTIGDADRDRIIALLKSAFGEGLSLGVLTERAADAISSANARATTELTSLNSAFEAGFAPEGLIAALNKSIVSFPLASAEVPASAAPFLRIAAADLTQLRAGHVLEIAGYTDNTGDPALNVALSQKRADAVRDALIKYGADQGMLIAKGYGSADPIASNDTPEGRLRNRRIEYHVVGTP